jgi:hypothetical protein
MKRKPLSRAQRCPIKTVFPLLNYRQCVVCGNMCILERLWAIPTSEPLSKAQSDPNGWAAYEAECQRMGFEPFPDNPMWHGRGHGLAGYHACRECMPTRELAENWRRQLFPDDYKS